jgi:mitochondrial import inner membrane translocase subunit TIM22
MQHPLLAPVFPAGREPLPPGMTEEDRANMLQIKKYQDYMSTGMESCLGKTAVAGVFGMPILTLAPPCLISDPHQVLPLVASFP